MDNVNKNNGNWANFRKTLNLDILNLDILNLDILFDIL